MSDSITRPCGLLRADGPPLDAIPSARVEPFRRVSPVTTLFVLTALTLASCGDSRPNLILVYSSEHFDYYIEEPVIEEGFVPCPEVMDGLERHYDSFSRYLGAELPEGERFTHVLGSVRFIRSECNGHDGCHTRGTMYSIYAADRHELVHAHNWLLGWGPLLFNEGLAEVLGCDQVYLNREPRWTPEELRAVLASEAYRAELLGDPLNARLKAMSLVRYLLDRFGKEAFIAFYRSFPAVKDYYSSEEVVEARFLDAFGERLLAVAQDWYASPLRPMDEYCLYLTECEHFEAMQGSSAEVDLSCGHGGLAWTDVKTGVQPITLEQDETLLMDLHASDDVESASVMLLRCEGGTATTRALGFGFEIGSGRRRGVVRLPAGRYFASMSSRQATTLNFQAIPLSRNEPACGVPRDPITLSSDDEAVLVFRRWVEDDACDDPDSAAWCPEGASLDVIPLTDGTLSVELGLEHAPASQSYYLCENPCEFEEGAPECIVEETIHGRRVDDTVEGPIVRGRRVTEGEQVRVAVGPTEHVRIPDNSSFMRLILRAEEPLVTNLIDEAEDEATSP
jgi:hypothetical protein